MFSALDGNYFVRQRRALGNSCTQTPSPREDCKGLQAISRDRKKNIRNVDAFLFLNIFFVSASKSIAAQDQKEKETQAGCKVDDLVKRVQGSGWTPRASTAGSRVAARALPLPAAQIPNTPGYDPWIPGCRKILLYHRGDLESISSPFGGQFPIFANKFSFVGQYLSAVLRVCGMFQPSRLRMQHLDRDIQTW